MNTIGTYVNGNTIVCLYEDGTKVRYVKEGERARPERPESMDLKITNRCGLGCEMCAESSNPEGLHANLYSSILNTIPPYTELAIGGGNPLEHPGLKDFLVRMRDQKVICNLTVNVYHFMNNLATMQSLTTMGLIHGLGISIPLKIPVNFDFDTLKDFPNAVIHTIAGYTPIETYLQLVNRDLNLLILGFKDKGNGKLVTTSSKYLTDLRVILPHLKHCFKGVAFDNLAVSQLKLKELFPKEELDKLYMGDDGEFTMYIDLVTGNYGKSSTHVLEQIDSDNICTLFKNIQ